MEEANFSAATFNTPFDHQGASGYLSIHAEMYPAKSPAPGGIAPTGRYFVYCLHSLHGSSHFIIEQDENCNWVCEFKPPFISADFVEWLGTKIQQHYK